MHFSAQIRITHIHINIWQTQNTIIWLGYKTEIRLHHDMEICFYSKSCKADEQITDYAYLGDMGRMSHAVPVSLRQRKLSVLSFHKMKTPTCIIFAQIFIRFWTSLQSHVEVGNKIFQPELWLIREMALGLKQDRLQVFLHHLGIEK